VAGRVRPVGTLWAAVLVSDLAMDAWRSRAASGAALGENQLYTARQFLSRQGSAMTGEGV